MKQQMPNKAEQWLATAAIDKDKRKMRQPDLAQLSERPWARLVLLTFLLIFGAGGSWAFLAPIAGAVVAYGIISTQDGVQSIQHPYGGIVKKVLVKEGESVTAGQVLMELNDEELRAKLEMTRARLIANLAELARLQAERDGAQDISFPSELTEDDGPLSRHAMKTQTDLFVARRKTLHDQEQSLRQRIAALQKSMEGARHQITSIDSRLKLIREEIDNVRQLFLKGNALKTRLLALRRTEAELIGKRGSLISEIARSRETISEIRFQIASMKKEFLARLLERISTLEREISVLRNDFRETKRKIGLSKIRSPSEGTVFNIQFKTPGAVIAPRQEIMNLAPDNQDIIIEAMVQPRDIENVKKGQRARVVFSSFSHSSETPEAYGEVSMVSPAPIKSNETGSAFFNVEIRISGKDLSNIKKYGSISHGIPVDVYITLPSRTFMSMIAKSFRPYKDKLLAYE